MYWIQTHEDGRVIEHWIDIDTVDVYGNTAEFSGIATSTVPDRVGDTLYVKVVDNGEPGAGYDEFSLSWDAPTYSAVYDVLDGNIQVHTYNGD
jgi:hypothetical protein